MISTLVKQLGCSMGRGAKCLPYFSRKTFQTLAVTVPKPFVYHVELNRPEKMNAMNIIMWMEIQKCFEELNNDSNCRVVILSGAGKTFTAGVDLSAFLVLIQNVAEVDDVVRKAKVIHDSLLKCQQSISQLEICNKPVLAAIHSGCIGGGVALATAADMRYCTKDAWFQVKEALLGIVADVGTIQRLPGIISESLSRELAYTARKLHADEAYKSGLVTQIFENKNTMMKEVLSLAECIAAKSPATIQIIKQSCIYGRDHSLEESLDQACLWNQLMIQSEDAINVSIAPAIKPNENVD